MEIWWASFQNMINPNFVFLGVAIQSIGGFQYLLETVRGKIQPNKVSWLLWSIAPLIAFVAEISQGVGIQALTTFIVGFVPLLIFIASFFNRKAEWKLGTLDIICGALSVLGLVLWYVTKVGNVAIFFCILADGLASLPTFVKSYLHPESESSSVYIAGVINAVIGLLIIQTWNFEHWGFPAYLLVSNGIDVILISIRPHVIAKTRSNS